MPLNAAILIVIPCYNEAHRFPKNDYLRFTSRERNYRFLFVDDGSRDQTFELLDSIRKEEPAHFEVLKLSQNSGKAEAVRQGMLQGLRNQTDFVGYWDADLATPLDTLPMFLDLFEQHPEIEMVFGSRVKLLGRDIKRNEIRHYLGRIFATAASIVLKLGVYDTQCGAKVFRTTEILRRILETPFQSRWIFDVELIARYLKQKGHTEARKSIYEFPLPVWHDIAGSRVTVVDFFHAFGELIRIYLTYR